MAKQRGFILKELMLYLFIGSLLLMTALQLFKMSWLVFSSTRRINEVSNDFINVSERLKFDLLGNIESITIGKTSFTFSFLQFKADNQTYVVKDYTFMMSGSRLIYNIYGDNQYTGIYLSSLVRGVQFEPIGDLLIILFDYGDYQFRRAYRLDHIKTKRVLYNFLPHSIDLSGRFNSGLVVSSGSEPHSKLHILV